MNIDWQLAERIQCSRKEREELVPLIDLVIRASGKARNEGLLALEDDIDGYDHPLVRLGMQLVVDGTDPDIIQHTLAARVLSENKTGKDLLEQIIICESMLSIQAGDNPRILAVKCFSYLGEDADELHIKYYADVAESREDELVVRYTSADGAVAECFADMRKILSLSDRAVQKVLRELDTAELAVALEGSESEVRAKILRNMSQRAAGLLVEETPPGANPDPVAVRKHVSKLFEIVAKLEEAGEIKSD